MSHCLITQMHLGYHQMRHLLFQVKLHNASEALQALHKMQDHWLEPMDKSLSFERDGGGFEEMRAQLATLADEVASELRQIRGNSDDLR